LQASSVAGAFAEQKRKRELDKLRRMIAGAFFLQGQQERKQSWQQAAESLTLQEIQDLQSTIVQENVLWKKGTRKIRFQHLQQQQAKDSQAKPQSEGEKQIWQIFQKQDFDLDFSRNPESESNTRELDNMTLPLIVRLATILQFSGNGNFQKTKLMLATSPQKFASLAEFFNFQKIKHKSSWQNFFKNVWPRFVASVAESFLLAKGTEAEILQLKNAWPNANASESDLLF